MNFFLLYKIKIQQTTHFIMSEQQQITTSPRLSVPTLWSLIRAIDAQEPELVKLIQSFIVGSSLIHISERTETTRGIVEHHLNKEDVLTLVFQSFSPIYWKRYLIFQFEKYFWDGGGYGDSCGEPTSESYLTCRVAKTLPVKYTQNMFSTEKHALENDPPPIELCLTDHIKQQILDGKWDICLYQEDIKVKIADVEYVIGKLNYPDYENKSYIQFLDEDFEYHEKDPTIQAALYGCSYRHDYDLECALMEEAEKKRAIEV